MPDNFISGNESYVKLGAVSYQFGKWKIPIDGGTKTFFAFGSNFQRTLPGGIKGQPSVEGAYDQGNMPLTVGALYELHLGWTTGVELVVNARLSTVEFGSEIGAGGEPGGKVTAGFESHGPFSVAFT